MTSDLHSKRTHAPVRFCLSGYAATGDVRWLALYGSAVALDSGPSHQ